MSLLKRLFRRSPKLTFRPLTKTAQLPTYATDGAAGLDLYADEDIVVPFLQRALVKTNIAVDLPAGIEAQVRARSGLALKKGIMVLNGPGTIDPDYAGGIGVILFNTEMQDFVIRRGDRIAQLVIASFVRVQPVLSNAEAARESARGAAGFGSTGTSALAAGGLAVAALAPSASAVSAAAISFETPVVIAAKLDLPIMPKAEPVKWVEGDPELMGDFSRPFIFRQDGRREFLDGKPSAAEAENARIQREVTKAIDEEMRQQMKPGGTLHRA